MRAVGKIITGILDGIAKILAFLLLSLGLWLPALFTIGFFIVCGAAKIELTGFVMGIYWAGLIVTALGGFTLSMRLRARRKRKEAERNGVQPIDAAPKKKKRKKGEDVAPQSDAGVYPPQQGYYPPNPNMQSMYYAPPQNGYMQQPLPPQQNAYMQQPMPQQQNNYAQSPYASAPQANAQRDSSDLDRKYFPEGMPSPPERYERTASYESESDVPRPYGKTMSKTQQREADSRLGADELWRRLSGSDVPDEKPLVFRTRQDPDLFIYEYSDRYQYWRRTKLGMVFERTEYKQAESRKRR